MSDNYTSYEARVSSTRAEPIISFSREEFLRIETEEIQRMHNGKAAIFFISFQTATFTHAKTTEFHLENFKQ